MNLRPIIAPILTLTLLIPALFHCGAQDLTDPFMADLLDLREQADSMRAGTDSCLIPVRHHDVFTAADLRPAVFDRYDLTDTITVAWPAPFDGGKCSDGAFDWLTDAEYNIVATRQMRRRFMIANPQLVRYNESLLPEPPKKYHAVVDPATAKLTFEEDPIFTTLPDANAPEFSLYVQKRHWLHDFDGRLQFSQAYLSPNWYQGGSNNLTMLLNLIYNVKLNQKFHPKMLAEASVSYKLAIHGTPEDSLRNYNISEDLFQFTGKVGYKAYNKWWYTVNAMFKTQFFKNYEVNSPTLRAAFLSPAELNMGIGMTYTHTNKKGTFNFDASVSPFSWNMKTCINPDMNVEDYGIRPGHEVAHEFGSSGEARLTWKLTGNISLVSRLFVFTDYTYLQSDWENTISFDINRFLSTQLYVHVRYDSSTPRLEDSKWHTWQIKEILSLGFSYKFATFTEKK